MSLIPSELDKIIKYLTPTFTSRKSSIVNFLREIYVNVSKRSNNNMNTYSFQEILNIPMIISDKIYFALNEHSNKMITQTQFSNGLYQMLYNDLLYKLRLSFEILDFDNDGTITKDDTFLILSHFHLIQNSNNTINNLEKLIDNFFLNDESLPREEFVDRCKKANSDISILLMIFINRYLFFFNEKEIIFYEKTINCYESPNKNSCSAINNYNNNNFSYLKNGYFKLTPKLLTYLESISLEIIEMGNENELSLEEEDEDLEDLMNFENDINEIFQKLHFVGYAYKNKITKNKTFIPQQRPFNINELTGRKGSNKDVANKSKFGSGDDGNTTALNSSNFDDTVIDPNKNNFVSPNQTLINQATTTSSNKNLKIVKKVFLQKAVTDFSGLPSNIKHKKNEVIVYKSNNNEKTNNIIKLCIINSFIFYFKQAKSVFILKKIIPIFSLFPKKNNVNSLTQLILISTIHNHYKQYSFLSENAEEIDHFIHLINVKAHHEKVRDHYEIKHDLGKGKFGSVVLAQDKKNSSTLYAIKIVNKNNPTDEEYKINRWESTIFCILKNISHPNVIKCYQKFENEKNIFFVYEYVKGSDLKIFTQIHGATSNMNTVIDISLQIIKGIACLHKYGIIHRDIKTTNILIESSRTNKTENNVKIIDFGLSRVLGKNEFSMDPYGSLCFKAPELIKHLPYNFKVDVWAIGITIYYLIFKVLPFEKGNKQQIKDSIVNDNLNFPLVEENYGDSEVNDMNNNGSFLYALIGECLEKKVESRPSMEKIIDKYVEKYQEDDF